MQTTLDKSRDQLVELIKSNPDGNLCYSPISLAIALAMLHAGSSGDSRSQLEKHLPDLSAFSFENTDFDEAVENNWTNLPPVVQYANSIWTNSNIQIKTKYAKYILEYFNAHSEEVDVQDPNGTAAKINEWVSSKTAGKIKDLVSPDQITKDLMLIIINAVYFKGSWKDPFEKYMTKDCNFTTQHGDIQTPTMTKTDDTHYAKYNGKQVVCLNFSGKNNYSLMLVKSDDHIKTARDFDPFALDFKIENIELRLPKFKIENKLQLKPLLKTLGVTNPFEFSEDFNTIYDKQSMKVDEVIQQTFIDVHEDGLEATAATAVTMEALVAEFSKSEPIKVHFDKPFMYYLVDKSAGLILFSGAILDPSE